MKPIYRSEVSRPRAATARSWSEVSRTREAGRVRAWQTLAPLVVGAVVLVGLVLRLTAATLLTPHVDEAASILAARMVVERGLPILPSGTVYLQGATLSYLLAPLAWLGFDGLRPLDLTVMRLVSVLAGTLAIYLVYRLGFLATRNAWVGVVAAGLVAIDPVSVQWSGHVRMYGLLQAITLGLALLFLRALIGPPTRLVPVGLVLLFGVGVFTHVGTGLLWPGMALVAWWVHGRALLGARRGLALALALCPLWAVALVGLNRALGSASVGAEAATPSHVVTFVGDNLLAPLARLRLRLSIDDLHGVVRDTTLVWLIPGLIVAVTSLIAGHRWLWGEERHRAVAGGATHADETRRYAVAALLALYWPTVVAVGIFIVSPKERYLLHVHLLGYVLVAAVALELLGSELRPTSGWRRLLGGVAVVGFAPTVVLGLVAGLVWRLDHPIVHPDYSAAMTYVAERRLPEEPVVSALPAIAYLGLDTTENLAFLAGPEGRPRAERYTRRAVDGRLVDYWIGVPSIVSPSQLCGVLRHHPDAWLVVDRQRLAAGWAYAGPMADAVLLGTRLAYEAPGGALVLRPAAPGALAVACGPGPRPEA